MPEIPVGANGAFTLVVTPEYLANRFKDSILPPVLATPLMILAMENAALNAIRNYLEPGETATVDVVLDPDVWQLHMPLVVARQVVLQGPGSDLFKLAIWAAVTVALIAIPLLEKLLILGFELVLQQDAVDVRALVAQPKSLRNCARRVW